MSEYAIIAGKGKLPKLLAERLEGAFIIGFEGQLPDEVEPSWTTNFGEIGGFVEKLQEIGAKKLVFAGGVKKPELSKIKTDAEGAKLLAKIMAKALFGSPGDDAIIKMVVEYLESKGFEVVGVDKILQDITTPKNFSVGEVPITSNIDIDVGLKEVHEHGKRDKGQAVAVEAGEVIAKEGEPGTEKMIEQAGQLKRKYAILVKASKPGQELRVDMPAFGADTVDQMADAGFTGAVLEAEKTLLIDKNEVIRKAEEQGIFITSV